MDVSGTGISGGYSFKIQRQYKPLTALSLKWSVVSDGNYQAVDRTATNDIYEAEVTVHNEQDVIDTFIDEIEANRAAGSNVVTLSNFNDTEQIFGADVDYSGSINATVVKIGPKTQNKWKSFSVKVVFSALTPSFTGSASLPTLKALDVGFLSDASYNITKLRTYDNTFFYQDHKDDAGIFEGTFLFSDAEAKAFRRLAATSRGGDISLTTISGVAEPFGSRRGGSYPYTVKLIKYEDSVYSVGRWKFKVQFAEVV